MTKARKRKTVKKKRTSGPIGTGPPCDECQEKMHLSAEGNYWQCKNWKYCTNHEIVRFNSEEGLARRPLGERDHGK